ncbi:MAG: tetratricopeptide repeat protein, partial [Nitrososphaerota archaeon]|nr:tetratricopeptide repeat protein [Nitrososphaerota archaeon]
EEHLWAKRYDRKLGDVFRIQSAIASQVASELKLKFARGVAELALPPTRDVEAHTLYLRARYHWNKRSEEGIKTAISYLEETINKDPGYSLALVGPSRLYSISALFGYMPPKKVYPRARELAFRALKAGGVSAEAHASMGEILMHYSYDWPAAARELERALQINSNYTTAHLWRSTCYAVLGQLDDAMAEARRADELDPFAVVVMNEVAKNSYYARKYDESIKQFVHSLEIEPESAYLHKGLAETYAQESFFKEAAREIERALTISGRSALYLDSAACVYAISNEERKSRKILEEIDRLAQNQFVPFYGRAAAHAVLGDKAKALQLLETAYDERSWLAWLKVDPIFDSLRKEQGFHSLLRKMNLGSELASNVSGISVSSIQTQETFEFESERSKIIFHQLASDFLRDYMALNFMEEKSGWRSIVEIARETGIPVSSLYSKVLGTAPPFRELLKRGLVEMRLSTGERGRGGDVTKIRIAYSKSPVRKYVDHLAGVVK